MKIIYIILFAVLSAGYSLQPLNAADSNNGLVAYWDFDEGSGTQVFDKSGSGINGVLRGDAFWVKEGKFGSAVRFNKNGCVDFGIDERLNPGMGNFTLQAWAKVDNAPQGFAMGKYNCRAGYLGYGFWSQAMGKRLAFTLSDDNGRGRWNNLTLDFPVDKWTNVALTIDREKGIVTYYENGVLKMHYEIPEVKGPVSCKAPFTLGRVHNFGGIERYMQGVVDEVTVWKRALSAEEIKSNMQKH